ncbi:helix-turn-helix domain-containing protein [Streptomyces cinerochromogenes]|uniref:helix-turn-helix domain-containing protein n=1 Tax=Streptomyces cinerochromogenes TaxID=66422 RepID=UPI003F54102C
MRRLLERQQAGELATRHVRAVAETVRVSERTVWRWLEQANATGQVEAPVRQGYAVSDEVWALLGEVGVSGWWGGSGWASAGSRC